MHRQRVCRAEEAKLTTAPYHEIRDPIHVFIKLDSHERDVLDSYPVQRLRHIHQLAMSYLVYPGATHRRFEHSLGVMELAGRVFDVITAERNLHSSVASVVMRIPDDERAYWRKVLRMAALCHDIGHLPFSHAAEHELLPDGWNHERITAQLIQGESMRKIWKSMRPPLIPKHVAKIAVGPDKMDEEDFSDWEAILFEIIGGDSFGVDRIDYLLRDSHHAGVAYGRFDHHRLIDTLRILPELEHPGAPERGVEAAQDEKDKSHEEGAPPTLGITIGGIHSTEALWLARYFMFKQVYLHRVRVAYDIHLQDFLREWLEGGKFSLENGSARVTDNEVLEAIRKTAGDPGAPGHAHAKRIYERKHFKPVYEITPSDTEKFEDPAKTILDACKERYGEDLVKEKIHSPPRKEITFPVIDSYGNLERANSLSETLANIPGENIGMVLVAPELATEETKSWVRTVLQK